MIKKYLNHFLLAFIFSFLTINFEAYSCSHEEPIDKFEKARKILFSNFEDYDPKKVYTSSIDEHFVEEDSNNPYSNFLKYLGNKPIYSPLEWSSKNQGIICEEILKITGIVNYRRHPIVIRNKEIFDYFFPKNFTRMINIELHHLTGDLMYITKTMNDDIYLHKINSLLEKSFKDNWVYENRQDKKGNVRSTKQLLELKVPDINIEDKIKIKERDIFLIFVKGLEAYENWEKKNYNSLESFYNEISSISEIFKYRFPYYISDKVFNLRVQRKFDLSYLENYLSSYNNYQYEYPIAGSPTYQDQRQIEIKEKEEAEEFALNKFLREHERLLYLSKEKNSSTNQMRGYAPSHLQNRYGHKEWDTTPVLIDKDKDRPDYNYYDKR